MAEVLVILLIMAVVFLALSSMVSFYRRYRRIHKQTTTPAAATENTAIVYTIPTTQPTGQTPSVDTGGGILFPNRTTPYNLRPVSSDLPPSYDDVTKNMAPPPTAAAAAAATPAVTS